MSIEQQLERIAVATEKCAAFLGQIAGNPVPAPVEAPKATGKKKSDMPAPAAAPVVAPAAEVDPFAQEEAQAAITIQQLEEKLRLHAKAFGTPTTLALMAKYGADKAKTTIKSVPTANYVALMAEIEADLKKK